jgi:hypothetical protein
MMQLNILRSKTHPHVHPLRCGYGGRVVACNGQDVKPQFAALALKLSALLGSPSPL